MKSLLERDWVKVVGHRDVPGKPAMYATTREFLDYFNLKTLDQLPPLADVKDLETMTSALPLEEFHDARADETGSEIAEDLDSEGQDSESQALDNQALDNQGIAVEPSPEESSAGVESE
jgi:segregation and condensation protein B